MEKGLINSTLHLFCIQNNKPIIEVAQYLQMKFRLEVDLLVLQKRLDKILHEEKAVA